MRLEARGQPSSNRGPSGQGERRVRAYGCHAIESRRSWQSPSGYLAITPFNAAKKSDGRRDSNGLRLLSSDGDIRPTTKGLTEKDEAELYRLSDLLRQVATQLGDDSQSLEALEKAGIALSFAFTQGDRRRLEKTFDLLCQPLGEAEFAHLRSLGIDPDAPLPHGAS